MPSLKAMAREAQKSPKSGVPERSARRKPLLANFKSTERVADSDLESETESDSGSDSEEEPISSAHPVAKIKTQKFMAPSPSSKANGHKIKPAMAGSGDKIQEEKEVDSSSETSRKHEISSDSSDEQQGKDESDSDSDSASESGSNGSVVEEEPEQHRISIAPPQKSRDSGTTTKTQLPRSIPTIDYGPPPGFEKHYSNQEAKTKVNQVFSPSNLAGKQLWYITAPASVPMSAIKEVSLQSVQLEKPALSLNGREYGFVQGHADEKGRAKIMVPDGNSPGYHLGRRGIDQTLHLQQIIQLPNLAQKTSLLGPSSHTSDKATVPTKKPIRQQPAGLMMRFRPSGFGSGRTGNIGSGPSSSESASSTESDPEEPARIPPAAFRRPVGLDQGHVDAHNRSAGAEKTGSRHSSLDSDTSSESPDEGMDDAQVKAEEPKASQSSQRPLKRKLSDVRMENSPTSPLKHPKTSSKILKTSKIPQLPAALKDSPSTKANGARKLKNISSESPPILGSSVKTRPVHPPRAPDLNITSSNTLNRSNKTTPILPPSRPHFPGSNPLYGHQGANGKAVTTSPGKNGRSKVGPNESMVESLAPHNQASEPASRQKKQKAEKRQRQKEAKRISQVERGASGTNAAGEAPDKASKSFSVLGNVTRSPTAIKPPPRLSLSKSSSEDKRSTAAPDTKNGISNFKKTETHMVRPAATKQNERMAILPKGATSILTTPARKESVILPPKFK